FKSFVLGTRPETSGWLSHYGGETPIEARKAGDLISAFAVEFFTSMMSLRAQILNTAEWPVPPPAGTLMRAVPSCAFRYVTNGCPQPVVAAATNAYVVADQDLAGMCPAVSIADNAIAEGGPSQAQTLQFSVTLAAPSDVPVTVAYATVDGSAV